MCISCRTARPQTEMYRLVRTPEGKVLLDETGRADGRGAYLCKEAACIERAALQRRGERALSSAIDAEIYKQLGDKHA